MSELNEGGGGTGEEEEGLHGSQSHGPSHNNHPSNIFLTFGWIPIRAPHANKEKLGLRGDSMRPRAFRIKVEDSLLSPRKTLNLVPYPHTRAYYHVSGPVPQTCALCKAGLTRVFFYLRRCNSPTGGSSPTKQGAKTRIRTLSKPA